ncbi:augmin complex subunit dgt2 [Drosophila innubila]|uniref:augmin complex subunit dgt2 n=1 Tax=Drosophila innubila TaxID=198719 RepID=UPI00148D6E8A|nr:augmin complex subunit dgt2 [Drosophila innubila]
MSDPSSTNLSTETRELLEARDSELNKVLKLKLVLNELRSLNLEQDETPEIKRVLRLISVNEYIRLGDEQVHLLDLQECSSCPPLSYTDCKALRTKLASNLRKTLTPIVELGDKIRKELPDAMTKDREPQLSTGQQEIIRLQKEQRECLQKLVEMQRKKNALMMTTADLKMGPHLVNELKVQQSQAELLQTKADLLRIYFINDIFTRTDHSLKAHKEVDKYLNELLSANQTKAVSGRR